MGFATFQRNRTTPARSERGFTLTEVMVAGVVTTMVMTSVARMMTSSLSSGSDIASRRRIENSIENNIQLIHQADSSLADYLEHNGESLQDACHSPTAFLAQELERENSIAFVERPRVSTSISSETINRTISPDIDNGITRVTYQFSAPEQNISTERRVLELSPNFQIHCMDGSSDPAATATNTVDSSGTIQDNTSERTTGTSAQKTQDPSTRKTQTSSKKKKADEAKKESNKKCTAQRRRKKKC